MAIDPHINPATGVWDDNYYAQNHLDPTVGGGAGNSSSGIGTPSVSTADLGNIRSQVFNTLKPYYLQLAKEAQGDFNRAVSQLREDYTTNTRNEKIQYAFTKDQQTQELNTSLAQLGVSQFTDQRKTIDELNKRGMAAYQNNPDGTPNALNTSTINSNTNFNVNPGDAYDTSSTIANPTDANMGEGGLELANLQRSEQLQQEAQQRASTRPIQAAGITLKQQTNLPAGVNPNLPPDQLATALGAPGVDRSQLGSQEKNLVRGTETGTRDLQKTQENLNNSMNTDVTNTTGQVVATGNKSASEAYLNQLAKDRTSQFINTGTGA